MRHVGLIGFPVNHSLSPIFQQAAFDALGLDVRYELWPTPAEEIPARIESLRSPEILGANVTVPHKQRVFDLVDRTSDLARRVGAVNTIVNAGDGLFGDNTDVAGFLTPLQSRGMDLSRLKVVVLGAGGAARGVVVALQSVDCERVSVANRTPERATLLASQLGGSISPCGLDQELVQHLRRADMLVNATSIGWTGDRLPLDAAMLDELPRTALVYDLTYRETPLLRAAATSGHQTLDGLEMLVAQGAESFRLWTGQEPPFELMLRAAQSAALSR